ncbi:MAG: T9SS type A sorting domain-containing protein [Candidatus Delongbacteria bacterium]|nr:T9SS type A sorting domain-containing protein [Candidatus Delongbacteria bacterium]
MKSTAAIFLSLLISGQLAFAVSNIDLLAEPKSADTRAAKVINPDAQLPVGETAFSHQRWDYENYDYWQLGTTWYEYQQSGSQGKQIVIGDDGMIHFTWMKGFNTGATERHSVYACFDGSVQGGNSVDNTGRSGYNTIDVLNENAVYANAAVVAFHQQPEANFVTALAPDFGPCWQAFLPFNHPSVQDWAENQPIWPHLTIDANNKAHVLSTRQDPSNQSFYDATTDFTTWEIPAWHQMASYSNAISSTPVSSEFDSRVALLTLNYLPVHPNDDGLIFSQSINDVWVTLSADGSFTDFSYVNVTDLLEEETTSHPLPGSVYAYCQIDGVFDADGNLHLVYNTRAFWAEYTLLDGQIADETYFERWSQDGQIWHVLINADGEVGEFSHVAGYVGSNNEDPAEWSNYFESNPGAWGSSIDNPSLAIDPADGALYCMFRNFTNLPDTSAASFANADVYLISSCDGGSTWGEAVNITDSQTPACAAGDCASEAWGTLAEVVDGEGLLHMEFVEDLDAGGIPHEEGSWTDNPVWYMQVPVTAVPCGDAWDLAPRATRLTDTAWNWAALEDGTYVIEDYMRVLNESRTPVTVNSIEILYSGTQPGIELTGDIPGEIAPYDYFEYSYRWTALIADSEYDAVVRFNTSGGTCDFTLANRNDLDLGTADSFVLWETVGESNAVPVSVELSQNYPNPFNPSTTIEYSLAAPCEVTLTVFNLLGEQVTVLVDGPRATGTHRVNFDAGDLTSGMYLYRLNTGTHAVTHKMVLVR